MESWESPKLYGNPDFFRGMYERVLISLLIDSDRRNTEDFMSSIVTEHPPADEELQKLWEKCQENVEKKISEFQDKSGINLYRSEISEACRRAAKIRCNLYRLTVTTGAGKTLSSLRYAVAHAKTFHKKRIIYVAPFHSILEQNADEIKDALGMSEIVLEHHCNIVMETDEEQERYDRLTEDWSSPVIVTTAVQFLNTLFSDKTGSVRRMHSLCDSVIIMDEVQALPIHVLEMFNLAVNFLTEFAGATMVFCTATQPLLEAIPKNRLRPAGIMIERSEDYRKKLRRTEIIDCTKQVPGGMSIAEAVGFILEKAREHKKVLFVANTKACARRIFQQLRETCENDANISHLSTSMCPKHRSKTLTMVKKSLDAPDDDKIQICISTQLIEAGVNISFRCVIRSLAGLDSIIQTAGRCNRDKQEALGLVYIIEMNAEAENLSRLREIRFAKDAMRSVLEQFAQHPETLDNQLDSAKAIKMYFEYYFKIHISSSGDPMSYPVSVHGNPSSLVNMLSNNCDFVSTKKPQWLKQAFKTAGEEFEAIAENGKISVVVPYDEKFVEQKLSKLEAPYVSLKIKKKDFKRASAIYGIHIPD